jgi:UDP:flavonoid glycosyltransferase YjiC (YdhE family)
MTGPQFDTSVRSRYAPVNLVILVSGPEPQRSLLQKIVVRQVLTLESTCVILQGLPGKPRRTDLTSTATLYNHLPAAQLGNLLREAEYVICRSGYTSIMDLALLEKKAMIIPTPGQTEQEYLADYLERKGFFLACSQEDLDLESALRELDSFEPEFSLPEWDLLDREVRSLF